MIFLRLMCLYLYAYEPKKVLIKGLDKDEHPKRCSLTEKNEHLVNLSNRFSKTLL